MTKEIEHPLAHGETFRHKSLHQLLHYVMEVKKKHGKDSWQYEDCITNLAQTLANYSDINQFEPKELYHYISGEHKAEVKDALDFLYESEKWLTRETVQENEYSQTRIIRDKEGVFGANPFHKPSMSLGYELFTVQNSLESPFVEKKNFSSFWGRPGYSRYSGRKQHSIFGKEMDKMMKQDSFNKLVGTFEEKDDE